MEFIYKFLITILWAVWLIYWTISAARAKTSVRRESAFSRASHFSPFGPGLLLLAWPDGSGNIFFAHCWPQTGAVFWCGALLTAFGQAFAVWARVVLGQNWSSDVTVKERHELIQSGPYTRIRHPIYTGLLVAFGGTALALSEWRGLMACALILAAFLIKMRIEERWMTETFGPAYESYRARTGLLLPKLG